MAMAMAMTGSSVVQRFHPLELEEKMTEDSTIWQQMSINYFYSLLQDRCLCFKVHSKYPPRDERKFSDYESVFYPKEACWHNSDVEKAIKQILKDLSEITYISCWYSSESLTDIVFKEYTKGNVGVAIGTTWNKLQTALCNAMVAPEDEFYFGHVVYRKANECKADKELKTCNVLTPFFIKSQNHEADREFRLCYLKNSELIKDKERWEYVQNNRNIVSPAFLNIGDPSKLISKVAVRSDDISTRNLTKFLIENCLKKPVTIETDETKKIDGFYILKIEGVD